MFKGGAVVEVFSAQGKDPVAKWKISGQSSVIKMFDKEIKGFLYSLEGSSQTHRMQLPKDGKTALGLIQTFLVLQVNIPPGKDFSTELLVTDQQHLKRRLYLSTIHKEFSATPLHARIPLICLQRNIWCNLCIDLGSFTAELFKGATFLSLDGIVISACCKVRRIFTMRTEPEDHVDKDPFDIKHYSTEEIPRSCQFPSEVPHVTQIISMERLRPADLRSVSISSETEQLSTGRAARSPKTQDTSHIAFGSKVTGRPLLTTKKASLFATVTEHKPNSGRSGRLKIQSPTEQASSENIGRGRSKQIPGAGKEKVITCNPGEIDRDQPTDHRIADQTCSSYSPEPVPSPSVCQSPFDSLDGLQILEKRNNAARKTSTPLSMDKAEEDYEEEVFTFFSCPHFAETGESSPQVFDDLSFDEGEGGRKEACLEDDFIGCESEEDQNFFGFHSKRFVAHTSPASSTLASVSIPRSASSPRPCPEPAKAFTVTHTSTLSSSERSRRTEIVCVAPTRCLSPSTAKRRGRQEHTGPERNSPDGDMRISINRTSVREIPPEDVKLHKVRESMRRMPVGSSTCDLSKRAEQEEDEEELRMLASLKRQQEEEEVEIGNSGLSASQVQHCNVSLSMSSDDTSTWTQCIPLASEQGQYYQKEMNPLLHSNPREWMDVLSPPIINPRQHQNESKKKHSNMSTEGLGAEESHNEDKFLSLLYDSCLNCYFDPQTGKYYEMI
ncbi:protein CFAP20DC [Clarias gariepinus]